MKKSILTLFGLLLLHGALLAQVRDLRIMSYNLRFGELASMEQIGKYIAEKDPDLVALQECDWNTVRKRAPKQNHVRFVNELGRVTGLFTAYGKALDYMGGYYGIGILSRYPIIRVDRVLLPHEGRAEQRVMLVVDVEMPDRGIVTFACTHLEVTSPEARHEQTGFINAYFARTPYPTFLAGDMNAAPDSPEIQRLTDDGWTPLTNSEPTYPASDPSIKIDHIFYRGELPIELKRTVTCDDSQLSDHRPVLSEVALGKE